MCTLAIDIGGTKVALGLVENGRITERCQFPTQKATSALQFAQQILSHCETWIPYISAVGVSTTGLVSEQGITAINPDTLAFPTPFPLADALEALTHKPVAMLNDAQAAAWFEYKNLESPSRSMAFITVSTGVGGGIIINDQLHKGAAGLAGHIGHTSIDMHGPDCGCGQRGCVEVIASGTAIKRASDDVFNPPISNIELFSIAKEEPVADQIIETSAHAIATLCCNLKASLDLEVIVLGGGVGLAAGYIERVQKHIANKPSVFQVSILPAKGDYDACLLGAAFQIKESL